MGTYVVLFFFQAEDGIRDLTVTGVQTCALPISICAFCGQNVAGSRNALMQHLGRHMEEVSFAVVTKPYEKWQRSEEHTSELQSQSNLVCRLLLEKKNRRLPRPFPVARRAATADS